MKRFILIALLSVPSILFSCQVILLNDSDTWIEVKDLNAENPSFKRIEPKRSIKANGDPSQHAHLAIKIGPKNGMSEKIYYVEQHACSRSHVIPIKSSRVEAMTPGNLFTITEHISLKR